MPKLHLSTKCWLSPIILTLIMGLAWTAVAQGRGLGRRSGKYPLIWRYEQESWEKNIIDMFCWSQILCRYLDRHRGWYDDDLQELKRAAEKKRQQGHGRQSLP